MYCASSDTYDIWRDVTLNTRRSSFLHDAFVASVRETCEMRLLLLMGREGIWVHLRLLEPLLGEELIDARCVFWSFCLWLERHCVRFMLDFVPVNIIEEYMLLEVLGIILATNTFCRIFFKELLK